MKIEIAGLEGVPLEVVKSPDGGFVVQKVGGAVRLHPHRMTTRRNAIQAAIEHMAGRDLCEVRQALDLWGSEEGK